MFCHFVSFDELKTVVVGPRVSDGPFRYVSRKEKVWNKGGQKYEKVTSISQVKKAPPTSTLAGCIFLLKLFLLIKTQNKRTEFTLEIKRFKHIFILFWHSCSLKSQPTCEHSLEVITSRGHHDSMHREGIICVTWHQSHITKQAFKSKLVKALQQVHELHH